MGVEQAASAGSRINKRSTAAMELELERGPGCSDLHQVARCRERQGAKARRAMRARRARRAGKVPFGAFPLLSFNQHGDQHEGVAGARDAARGACEPRTSPLPLPASATSGATRIQANQSVACRMERIEAAEEAHCSLP
jgi:hypothetical protein